MQHESNTRQCRNFVGRRSSSTRWKWWTTHTDTWSIFRLRFQVQGWVSLRRSLNKTQACIRELCWHCHCILCEYINTVNLFNWFHAVFIWLNNCCSCHRLGTRIMRSISNSSGMLVAVLTLSIPMCLIKGKVTESSSFISGLILLRTSIRTQSFGIRKTLCKSSSLLEFLNFLVLEHEKCLVPCISDSSLMA